MKTLVPIALVAAILGQAAPSLAYHDEESPSTDNTPYTLDDNEWRVGLWKLEYGSPFGGDLQFGTWTVYWAPWIVGARLFNANAKYQLWASERTSFAAGLGLFYLDLEDLAETPVTMTVVPFDLYAAHRMNSWLTVGARFNVTSANIDGTYNPDDISQLQGALAGSSAQLGLSAIWRMSRVTSFELEWRTGRYLEVIGQGIFTTEINDQTEVTVFGEGNADFNDKNLTSIAGRFHFSWKHVNLRLGMVFGNYTIAGVNFIVPERIPFPEFDLFVRF